MLRRPEVTDALFGRLVSALRQTEPQYPWQAAVAEQSSANGSDRKASIDPIFSRKLDLKFNHMIFLSLRNVISSMLLSFAVDYLYAVQQSPERYGAALRLIRDAEMPPLLINAKEEGITSVQCMPVPATYAQFIWRCSWPDLFAFFLFLACARTQPFTLR